MITQRFAQFMAALNGRRFGLVFLLVFFIGLLSLRPQQAGAMGSIYYVKPVASGTGDGSSWANAATLQDTLGSANNGDEVWVAAGTYVPGASESDSFHLAPGVEVYGGFDGTETLLEERDWASNLTVLSGDIGDDDTNKVNGLVMEAADIVGGNSDHVVYADGTTGTPITASTILDGFTITAGQADGSPPEDRGGAFYCAGGVAGSECSPSLSNISFSANAAYHGGAMFNASDLGGSSSPSLTNVSFSSNMAVYNGGAMVNFGCYGGSSSPILTNVSFYGNTADIDGGAMYNYGSDYGSSHPSLSNVSFTGNTATDDGGAMYNYGGDGGSSHPSLSNVFFYGNTASTNGGAMFNDSSSNGSSSPILTNVTFSRNWASYGGAIFNYSHDGGYVGSSSSPILTNVTFFGNWADDGGAMYNYGGGGGSSHPRLSNVSFYGNAASNDGGAMLNYSSFRGGSSPILTNVSFSSNSASDSGGAMYNYGGDGGSSHPSLSNVILWGDSATGDGPEIQNIGDGANSTICHSLIAGGVGSIPGAVDGGGNLSANPLFVDAAGGDLRLQIGSPAIDAGDNSAMAGVLSDLDGSPRFVDGDGDDTVIVDMGAYEFQTCPAATILYINQAATGSGSGDDWANAMPSLAVALGRAAVCDVDEIWVAAGIYTPGVSESDSFNLVPGVGVYGGFAGTETTREERDWAANLAVLSGDIANDDTNKVNGVVTDTAHIVGANSDNVVFADGASGTPITGSTILDGFTITAGKKDVSYPENRGGGFYCAGSGAESDCSPTLRNISFSGNTAVSAGGAMYNDGRYGGGGSPSLTNVTFYGNTAYEGGAIVNDGRYGGSSNPSLTNVSFSGNTAVNDGGAMVNVGYNGICSPILTNVILWGDSAPAPLGPEISNYAASPTISTSLIAGGVGSIPGAVDGGGNLAADPLFVDAAGGDLRLQPGSPAIDAGHDSAVAGIPTDLAGNPRFVDGDGDGVATVDMGAYEYVPTQAIALAGGWNLISLCVQPDDSALDAVLAGIAPDVVLLKNGQGQVYWPAYGVDQIGDWQMSEGYQIYLNAPAELSVSGSAAVPAQAPVSLGVGWNMVAYPRDSSMAIETALAGISGDLLLVKDEEGQVYWPDQGINTIGDMEPGEGYQIYMDSAAMLTYPGN